MYKYLFLLLIFLSSCYSQKKATFQITKAQSQYPTMVAGKCGLWYPPKIYDSIRTEYVQGETEYSFDTIRIDCDSVVNNARNAENLAVSKIVYKYIKVPKLRVDTLFDHQYHTVENTAEIEQYKGFYDKQKDILDRTMIKAKELDTKRIFWMKFAILLCCYLVIKTALRLFFPKNIILNKLP